MCPEFCSSDWKYGVKEEYETLPGTGEKVPVKTLEKFEEEEITNDVIGTLTEDKTLKIICSDIWP